MKKQIVAILALFFCALSLNAQDYNYSFYPAPQYAKYELVNKFDTITKAVVPKIDSLKRTVNVIVEKQNDRFTVRNIANTSEVLYAMNVKFAGVDQNRRLVYQAASKDNEVVYVDPLAGLVSIEFTSCFDEPVKDQAGMVKKHCNIVRHIFGSPPVVKPQVTPEKPKEPVTPKKN